MNLQAKIEHLQEASMHEARAEGNAIIQAHKDALMKLFEEHKEEALRQSEVRLKSGEVNAKTKLNKAKADVQTNIKREEGKCQAELKNRLFEEVESMVDAYMKTDAYMDSLAEYIIKAARFAKGADLTIFINPTDEDKKEELQERTGMKLTVSKEDFVGGVRAVIHERNILIDHSYKATLESEYDSFLFPGGESDE